MEVQNSVIKNLFFYFVENRISNSISIRKNQVTVERLSLVIKLSCEVFHYIVSFYTTFTLI